MSDPEWNLWKFIVDDSKGLSFLIASLSLAITSAYGFIQIRLAAKAREKDIKQKQNEATWKIVQDLIKSDEYNAISDVFDINGVLFKYKNTEFRFNHSEAHHLFRTENMILSEEEIAIRTCLDRYAQNLSLIEIGLKSDYLSFEVIKSILIYDMKRIKRFESVTNYLKYFQFDEAVAFIDRFELGERL